MEEYICVRKNTSQSFHKKICIWAPLNKLALLQSITLVILLFIICPIFRNIIDIEISGIFYYLRQNAQDASLN